MREFWVYEDEEGLWIAECPELPGYRAEGKTKDEAMARMKSALLLYYPCRCED